MVAYLTFVFSKNMTVVLLVSFVIVNLYMHSGMIIEGAGGLLVPLNDKELILDLIKKLDVQVIVVSQNYLGSINHTLLTINTLVQHQIKIKGIIFNGDENTESENYILKYSKIDCLGHIPTFKNLDQTSIIEAGKAINM